MNYHWFMLIAACRLAVVQREYKLWHIRSRIYYFLHERRLTGRLLLREHDIFLRGGGREKKKSDGDFHQSPQVQWCLMWFAAHNHEDKTAKETSCQSRWSQATMKEYFNQLCCVLFPSKVPFLSEFQTTTKLKSKNDKKNWRKKNEEWTTEGEHGKHSASFIYRFLYLI